MTKEEKINQIAAEITPGEISKAEEVKKTDPEALKGPEEVKDPGVPGELPMLADGMIDAAALSGGVVDGKDNTNAGKYLSKDSTNSFVGDFSTPFGRSK